VTVKGQVTIPKPLRDHLGLTPGTQVEFELAEDGRVVLRRADAAALSPYHARIARVRGTARSGMTTDEIMRFLRGEPD
jgi:AbrB family looped-hinge helix DNA binding protein